MSVPKGAIVGETIKASDGDTGHCVVFFDRPGRIEISVSKNGLLVLHVYDGTKVDMEQPPVGGFMLGDHPVHERWVSEKPGQEGVVDHDF